MAGTRGAQLDKYELQSVGKNKHANRLALYRELFGHNIGRPANSYADAIGMAVHSLIMARLAGKAGREGAKNARRMQAKLGELRGQQAAAKGEKRSFLKGMADDKLRSGEKVADMQVGAKRDIADRQISEGRAKEERDRAYDWHKTKYGEKHKDRRSGESLLNNLYANSFENPIDRFRFAYNISKGGNLENEIGKVKKVIVSSPMSKITGGYLGTSIPKIKYDKQEG
jgi:hypothetical protein